MKLDFGEVLGNAGKIVWKHKVMLIPGVILAVVGYLPAPLMFYMQSLSFSSMTDLSGYEAMPDFEMMFLPSLVMMALMLVSIPVSLMGMTMPMWGTVQVDRGAEKLTLAGMFTGTLKYFWRLLGLKQLLDVTLQHFTGHAETAAGIEHLFTRKKQYLQSRLQSAPVGFARRWKAGARFRE